MLLNRPHFLSDFIVTLGGMTDFKIFSGEEKVLSDVFFQKVSYEFAMVYAWKILRSKKQECTLLTQVTLTNANFAVYNWTEMNPLSVNSYLCARDITSPSDTSLQWIT